MTIERTGQVTDFANQGTEFSVTMQDTDGVEINGTSYIPNFKKWNGYYRQIPELRTVINKFASWTFGRGIKGGEEQLNKIKGFGKDSARSVLKNQWRTALICGDSFAHILPSGNLKPLNPGTIAILVNEYGIIVGYEQEKRNKIYSPEEIYHLSYERIADEIHGIPFPEALEELIKSRNEGLSDLRILYHRNIKPINFFEVETDDTTKLQSVENTINQAYRLSENVVIPAGVIKEIKKSSLGQGGAIDSLPYIKFLVREFVTGCGMPEIIMGWSEGTSEASGNIAYLGFQQEIEDMQLYNQEQIKDQLGIEINLEFPASLEEDIKENESKRGEGTSMNPNKDG